MNREFTNKYVLSAYLLSRNVLDARNMAVNRMRTGRKIPASPENAFWWRKTEKKQKNQRCRQLKDEYFEEKARNLRGRAGRRITM